MMQYLNKGSLTRRGGRIQAVNLKIDLAERTSTITATVIGNTVPNLDDWLITDEGPAAGMVWCVRDTDDQHIGTGKYSFTAESVLTVMKGKILFGKVTAADITGNKKDVNCTAKQAVQFVLGKQTEKHFVLGTIEYTDKKPYHFNGENIYDALETITNSLTDAYWDIDFSVYPFKINIRKLSDSVDSEMRWSRNIASPIKKTMSKSGMYTVFYPIGKNNLSLPEKYMAMNVSKYGRYEKTETDQSIETVDALRAWAEEKLRRHAKPLATVTMTGIDLSKKTGEALDKIRINRVCRVPIQGEETIAERVIRLTWPDWIKEPENMSVTLCNQETDVASVIREMQKSGGRSGRTAAKNAEEDHAWFEDTNDHVSMVAMAIIGKNPDGVDWKRVSDLTVGPNGIAGTVDAMEGDMKRYGTKLEQNEKSIGMVVGTYPDGSNYVKAGEICMAINESGSAEAYINASKIHLLGQTIASYISAEYIKNKIADIASLTVKAVTGTTASFNSLYGGNIKFRVSSGSGYAYTDLKDLFLSNIELRGPTNNTYTLVQHTPNNPTGVVIGTFSRATTLSGAWSGGVFTVDASPQGKQIKTQIFDLTNSDISWSGVNGTIAVHANIDGDEVKRDTGKRLHVTAPFSQLSMAKAYDRNDFVYYGRLYDSAGNALTAGSYYWYGSNYNYDGGSANATFYRHN